MREVSMLGLHIRPARPGEEGLVHSFIRELADYEELLHCVEATDQTVREALFSPHPRVFCDIAEWDGAPAGFGLWFYNYSTFMARFGIYLEDLYVRPEYRNKGIGKALLVHLAARAVAEGCGRLDWSVLNWNKPSIAFYESLGAKPVDGWTVYRLTGEALHTLSGR